VPTKFATKDWTTEQGLRGVIASADEAIPRLLDAIGSALSRGDHTSIQTIREQLADVRRQREEAEAALPHVEKRDAERAERRAGVPDLTRELKRLMAERARLVVTARLASNQLVSARAAVEQFDRANESRIGSLRSEILSVGGELAWLAQMELIKGIPALEQIAKRLEAEADGQPEAMPLPKAPPWPRQAEGWAPAGRRVVKSA
jgi:hypothetical protein